MTTGRAKSNVFARSLAVSMVALAMSMAPAAATTVDELLEDARTYRAEGRLNESVIQIKNVLQREPSSAAAHALLGAVYLDAGDLRRAIDELERGRDLGAPAGDWLLPLVRARIAEARAEDALKMARDLPESLDPALRGDALALAGQGMMADSRQVARTLLEEGRALHPGSVPARVGLGRLALYEGQTDRAATLAAEALAAAPRDAEALNLAADVARVQGDIEAVLRHHKALIDAYPQNPFVRLPYAAALLEQGEAQAAVRELDWVLARVDGLPRAHYLRGVGSFVLNDLSEAERQAARAMTLAPGDPAARLLAGLVKHRQGEHEQAVQFLSGVPDRSDDARLALAASLLETGRADRAYEELKPVAGRMRDDGRALALLGSAAAGAGDLEAARAALEQAIALRPDDAGLHRRLGLVLTQRDKAAGPEAIAALKQAHELDPGDLRIAEELFGMMLATERMEEAGAVAAVVQDRHPEKARGHVMQGLALADGDPLGAARAFRAALEKDPADPDAATNLAALLVREGDREAARTVLTGAIEARPRNVALMLRLAELEQALGRRAEARTLLERAHQIAPEAVAPRVRLARLLLQDGRPEGAMALLVPALNNNPRDPVLLRALTETRLATGAALDALASARALVEVAPTDHSYRVLAEAAMRAGDRETIREALEGVIERAPDEAGPRVLLARALRSAGDLAASDAQLEAARAIAPDSDEVLEEDARLRLARQPSDGIAFLREQVAQRGEAAPRWMVSLLAAAEYDTGDADAARERLTRWIAASPEDSAARWMLANWHIAAEDWVPARMTLEPLVASAPANWMARNNLAWVLLKQGSVREALEQVTAAREAAGRDRAPILDTEARIRLAMGDTAAAERLFREASLIEDRPVYRLGLAETLVAQSKMEEAKAELERLLAGAAGFAERDRATELLAEVRPAAE